MRMRANRQVCCPHFHRGWWQEQTGLTFESNTSTGRPENRVYRLSRTLPKELDPLVGQEERGEKEGKGEEERAGYVFLTFCLVFGLASAVWDR